MKYQYNKEQVYYPLKRRITIIIFIIICMSVLTLYGDSTDINLSFASTILYINEFMADNQSTIEDPHEPGSFEDWIEIYNPGNVAVNMSGMHLTDDLNEPAQWQIPTGVSIPAKGYLLFWADDDEKQGTTHTNFKLSMGGEKIGLFGADGITMIDSIEFGAQITDVSYGRYPNGGGNWGFMAATPCASNSTHNAPPTITGTTRAPVSPADGESVWVTCSVTDEGSESDVTLTYDPGTGAVKIGMYDDGAHNDGGFEDNLFGAGIPGFAKSTVVKYYISATDDLGAISQDPVNAPTVMNSYMVGYIAPMLFISEFMADNDSTIEDLNEPGSFEDWIEIYNAGDVAVNLSGMYLSDDLGDPTQWQIPEGVGIPAKGYLLFWADSNEEEGIMHTNFKLSKSGGEIGLFDTTFKGNMAIDKVIFGEQAIDISYGRIYDCGAPWVFLKNSTPGSTNYFPNGTYIYNFSYVIDSYTVIQESEADINVSKGYNPSSEKWETSYILWGNPAGNNFSLKPGTKYIISISK